jgi:hypothetical protein
MSTTIRSTGLPRSTPAILTSYRRHSDANQSRSRERPACRPSVGSLYQGTAKMIELWQTRSAVCGVGMSRNHAARVSGGDTARREITCPEKRDGRLQRSYWPRRSP